ncbi:VRR-NUC domain containing protein [uncultured Caudovirales phage]|uniref:VRR-NUC domain containing protein n=1 Tax=uncultured Caudovirales phage TaxID=2100421 RepID=A0A6J5KKI6_9CAUD|nr:VRR-NUC domain containing protein [uncultured Caudovirales phage]
MDISANELTKWAKLNLGYMGFRLNRVNNIPYGKRKGTIEKGWADLQGYTPDGKYVAIEIKKLGDRLSQEQKERLQDIHNCGGIVYICTEVGNKPTLVEWTKIKL